MRVLHFRRLYSLVSEPFVHDVVLEMERQGHESRMACAVRLHADRRPHEALSVVHLPRWLHLGGRMAYAFGSGFGHREADVVLWPLLRHRLRAMVRAANPDVVLAHFGPDGCLIEPVASGLGIPIAVSFYGYDVSRLVHDPRSSWPRRYLDLFRRAALLIAISEHVRSALLDLGAPEQKIVVVPLGCDLRRFVPVPPRSGHDAIRLVGVGRLTAKKSPLDLLRSFARARELLAGGPDLELILAGDGELRGACVREIERLGLGAQVRLLGAVDHERVPSLLAGADAFVQHCRTSPNGDQEGQGVSFVEAGATGLPTVSTRHAGTADVLRHGENALLSAEGDVEGMARNLARIARDAGLRESLGRCALERVRERYSLERTADLLLEHLDRARTDGTPPYELHALPPRRLQLLPGTRVRRERRARR